jgi:hypothetical protein
MVGMMFPWWLFEDGGTPPVTKGLPPLLGRLFTAIVNWLVQDHSAGGLPAAANLWNAVELAAVGEVIVSHGRF